MAQSDKYKEYSRGDRKIILEENFSSGMACGDIPLTESYCRALVNYNVSDSGMSLVPRRGLVLKWASDDLPFSLINLPEVLFTEFCNVPEMDGEDIVSENLYKLVGVGHPTPLQDYVVAADGVPLSRYSVDLADSKFFINDTLLTPETEETEKIIGIAGPTQDIKIHTDLPTFNISPRLLYTNLLNKMYGLSSTDLLEFSPSYKTGDAIATASLNCTKVVPKRVNAQDVLSVGYNMLSLDPFALDNVEGSVWQLFGMLPYHPNTNDIFLDYKAGDLVEFKLNYQSGVPLDADKVTVYKSNALQVLGVPEEYTPPAPDIYLSLEYTDSSGEFVPVPGIWTRLPGQSWEYTATSVERMDMYKMVASPIKEICVRLPVPAMDFSFRASFKYYRFAKTWLYSFLTFIMANINQIRKKAPIYPTFEEQFSYWDRQGLDDFLETSGTTETHPAFFRNFDEITQWASSVTGIYDSNFKSNGFLSDRITTQGGWANFRTMTIESLLNGAYRPAHFDPIVQTFTCPNTAEFSSGQDYLKFFIKYLAITEYNLDVMTMPFCGAESASKLDSFDLKGYNLRNALGLLSWKQRLLVWGVPGATNTIFTSEIKTPSYFPYPSGIIEYERPILQVIKFLDGLLVFTADTIYSTSLNADGLSFTTKTVADNVALTTYDLPAIVPIRNMLFYKSGNYYYMLVPNTRVLTEGSYLVAPVSKPINYFLDHFSVEFRSIFNDMYADYYNLLDLTDPRICDIIPDLYDVVVANDVIKVYYYFNIDIDAKYGTYPRIRVAFVLKYDTITRVWTTELFEVPTGKFFLYTKNSAGVPEYGIVTTSAEDAKFQVLQEDINSTVDSYLDPAHVHLETRQFLDTGFRALLSGWKKRFREIQLKINDPLNVPLYFRVGFAVDTVTRNELFTDTRLKSPGSSTLMDADAETLDSNEYAWTLSGERLSASTIDSLKLPVSGKGYLPRFKLLSSNLKVHGLLGIAWIFRKLNAR